jgi:uncharacterized protein (DUF2267 family)
MRYREFIQQVTHATGESEQQGEETVEVVLSTLAVRIPRTVRENLAAQLPDELKALMRLSEETKRFGAEEFYNRISARREVKRRRAEELVAGVGAALGSAVSSAQVEKVRSALPQEFDHIFS